MTQNERFNMTRNFTMTKFNNALALNKVDESLIDYLHKYNKLRNTYTTSSCAGRIIIIGLDKEETKKPDLFVGKWHRPVKFNEIYDCLDTNKFDELWFKQEPFIIHIVAKSMREAEKILNAKKDAGIKKGGIISLKDGKIVVEIVGSGYMSFPVKMNNKILFNKTQFKILIQKANQKVRANTKRMWKFLKVLYKEMKKK